MAIVIDEAKLTELVHEEADARSRGADHFGQHLLTDRRYDRFRLSLLAEICKEQKKARQSLLAGVEELVDKVGLGAHAALKQELQEEI